MSSDVLNGEHGTDELKGDEGSNLLVICQTEDDIAEMGLTDTIITLC